MEKFSESRLAVSETIGLALAIAPNEIIYLKYI